LSGSDNPDIMQAKEIW